jgi:hypothetical protein
MSLAFITCAEKKGVLVTTETIREKQLEPANHTMFASRNQGSIDKQVL